MKQIREEVFSVRLSKLLRHTATWQLQENMFSVEFVPKTNWTSRVEAVGTPPP
jgi:hypothetical protein